MEIFNIDVHILLLVLFLAIVQCFSSTSTDVQTATGKFLICQIRTNDDVPTFLYIYTQEGLKSSNLRVAVKSIEILTDLLTKTHQHENISPIFELLLQRLQDNQFRANYNQILLRAIDHCRRILTPELLNTYLESYSPALRRLYHTYVPQQISKDPDDDTDQTPRASVQVTHVKDSQTGIHSPLNKSIAFLFLRLSFERKLSFRKQLFRSKDQCNRNIGYLCFTGNYSIKMVIIY